MRDDLNLVCGSGGARVLVAGVLMLACGILPCLDLIPAVVARGDGPVGMVVAGALVGVLGLCAFVTIPVGAMLILVAAFMGSRELVARLRPRRDVPPSPREEVVGPYRTRAARAIPPTDLLSRSTRRMRAKLLGAGLLFAAGAAVVLARVNLSANMSANMSSHDGFVLVVGAPLLVFAAALGVSALFVRGV